MGASKELDLTDEFSIYKIKFRFIGCFITNVKIKRKKEDNWENVNIKDFVMFLMTHLNEKDKADIISETSAEIVVNNL